MSVTATSLSLAKQLRNDAPHARFKSSSPPLANGISKLAAADLAALTESELLLERALPVGPRLETGTAGDHPLVYQFLMAVFQGPSREAFFGSLEQPQYEPSDRLLVKIGRQIVSHALVTHRLWNWGGLGLPTLDLSWVATLPEFRGQGHGRRLLAAVDGLLAGGEGLLAAVRTPAPHFFRDSGWVMCGRHSYSRCKTRDLLTQLPPQQEATPSDVYIRPWRQVELPGLLRLYAEAMRGSYGRYERTEDHWRWLVSHADIDQMYVAVRGKPKADLDDGGASIIGYCVTRGPEVLELFAGGGQPLIARRLLATACRDAVERDDNVFTLHAAPDDPLHKLFVAAGGSTCYDEAQQGEVFMMRLPDPWAFLRNLLPELHRRASFGGLERPCEFGLCVEGRKLMLLVTRRSVRLVPHKLGRSYLTLNEAEFVRLLMGHTNLAEALSRGRIESSTRTALDTASVLFPQLPIWRPALEHLFD